jgi:hypothetical protein
VILKRIFVYADLFEKALKGRKKFPEILEAIEASLLQNPKCGDVVAGTGGVRKFRSEDLERNKGKRGGFRVLYLDLPHVERTHLLFLYDKSQADDLSVDGKKRIKELVEEIKGDK